jgi:hypothetical protein
MLETVRPPRCPACVMQRSPPCFCLPCVALRIGVASPRDMIFALDPVQRMSAETPFVGLVISLLSHRQTKGLHRFLRKATMVPAKKDNVIAVYAATRSNARPCPIGKGGANFAADSPRWLRPMCPWDRNKSGHPITDKSSGCQQTVKRLLCPPNTSHKTPQGEHDVVWRRANQFFQRNTTFQLALSPCAWSFSSKLPTPPRNVAPRLHGF